MQIWTLALQMSINKIVVYQRFKEFLYRILDTIWTLGYAKKGQL